MAERLADKEGLLRFRAFLRGEEVCLRDLARVMGYNESYVSQVLGGIKPLSSIFRESIREALVSQFLSCPAAVDKQIEALQSSYFVEGRWERPRSDKNINGG